MVLQRHSACKRSLNPCPCSAGAHSARALMWVEADGHIKHKHNCHR